ncbi:histone deacetylase-like amidohydrolase [Acidithrix ferrooxidans]|uniref:Histone deacetylase-like amidohydrolase n=2 Tax=Acidithrix ferrooxidans TaxID=1280514 RepID=A0A0D8HFK1_9ACTN|nr:histone deacetylase-like amidohydrolase [Acidithrix ferrooxidans]
MDLSYWVMAILVGTHKKFHEHDSGTDHPERPERLEAVLEGVDLSGVGEAVIHFEPTPAKMEDLYRVHDKNYIDALRRFCLMGGGRLDPDTSVSVASWDAAILAAGAGLDAIRRLGDNEADSAFLAVRPPGHHAVIDRAMGFCLINNVAVAAASLASQGERVLIFDYDAHHGNGTQDIFYSSKDVMYASVHQYPLYPGSGRASEVGVGEGLGTTINIPVPEGTTGATYFGAIEQILMPAIEKFSPTWVVASSGFDSHIGDPLCDLGLTSSDFGSLITWLFSLVPGGRRLAFLEGGYDLDALRLSTAETIAAMGGETLHLERASEGGALVGVLNAIREQRARSLEL